MKKEGGMMEHYLLFVGEIATDYDVLVTDFKDCFKTLEDAKAAAEQSNCIIMRCNEEGARLVVRGEWERVYMHDPAAFEKWSAEIAAGNMAVPPSRDEFRWQYFEPGQVHE